MPDVSEKAQDLYREAARNTLRHVEKGNEPLSYLLLHLDNDFAAAERLIVAHLSAPPPQLVRSRDIGAIFCPGVNWQYGPPSGGG